MDFPDFSGSCLFNFSQSADPLQYLLSSPQCETSARPLQTSNTQQNLLREASDIFQYEGITNSQVFPDQPYLRPHSDILDNFTIATQKSVADPVPVSQNEGAMLGDVQNGDAPTNLADVFNEAIKAAKISLTAPPPRPVDGIFMNGADNFCEYPTTFADVDNNLFAPSQNSLVASQPRPFYGTSREEVEHLGDIPITFNDINSDVFAPLQNSSSASQPRSVYNTFVDDAEQAGNIPSTFNDLNTDVFETQQNSSASQLRPLDRAVDHTVTESVGQNAASERQILPPRPTPVAYPGELASNEPDRQFRPSRKRNNSGRLVEAAQPSVGTQEENDDDTVADLQADIDDEGVAADAEYERLHSDIVDNNNLADRGLDGMDEEVHCKVCNKKFGDKASLKRHFARLHSQPPPQSSQGCRCEICNAPFKNEINLKRHINNAHTGKLDFKCKVCSAGFATDRGLSLHIGKEHSDKKPEEGGPKRKRRRKTNKVYECDFCSYKSDQRFNVTRHFKSQHTNQEKWYCPHGCGKVCKSKANMKTHTMSCRQRPI